MLSNRAIFSWLIVLAGIWLPTNGSAQLTFETRMLTGEVAPIPAPTIGFLTFENPLLGESGQVVFVSDAQRGTCPYCDNEPSSIGRANYSVGPAGDRLVLEASDVFDRVDRILVNDVGQSLSFAIFNISEPRLYIENQGLVEAIAGEDEQAASLPEGVLYQDFPLIDQLFFNNAGHTAFVARLTGGDTTSLNNFAIFKGGIQSLDPIARKNDLVPGKSDLAFLSFDEIGALNDYSEIVFIVTAVPSREGLETAVALMSDIGGELQIVALEGEAVSTDNMDLQWGRKNGAVFSNASTNNAGQVLFVARLSGSETDASNDTAICLAEAENVSFVARTGDPIAPTSADIFDSFSGFPIVNGEGSVAFRSQVRTAGNTADIRETLILQLAGNNEVVACESMAAPGTTDGVSFGKFFSGDIFGDPVVNRAGQMAFFGRLTGPGITDANNTGIWARLSDGSVQKIARAGDVFTSNQKQISAVGRFRGAGGEDGRENVLTESGQFVFCLEFADGTEGVFIADLNSDELQFSTVRLTDDFTPVDQQQYLYENSFGLPDLPTIDSAGNVGFVACFTGVGGDQNGVFRVGPDFNRIEAASGLAAPTDLGEFVFSDFRAPVMTDSGAIAFETEIEENFGSGLESVYLNDGTSLNSVAIRLSPFPLIPNASFGGGMFAGNIFDDRISVNENGDTAQLAAIFGTGINSSNDHIIFGQQDGLPVLYAREGDFVPDMPTGTTLDLFEPNFASTTGSAPSLNVHGELVFSAWLDNGPLGNQRTLFGVREGNLRVIFKQNDLVPGLPSGEVWVSFGGQPRINDSRDIVFNAEVIDGQGDTDRVLMIFNDDDEDLQLVARSGDLVPGDNPLVLNSIQFTYTLNEPGQVAFHASLVDLNGNDAGDGIFLYDGTELQTIVKTGDPAPGFDNATFGGFESRLAMNKHGQLAFSAFLTGPGFDGTNSLGLWMTDRKGLIQSVVQQGFDFDVNDDPDETDMQIPFETGFVNFGGGGDSSPIALNDAGQFVFSIDFLGGTEGIFVADSNPVLLGDLNGDGVVDLLDIAPFVDLLSSGQFDPAGDFNQDGVFDLLDVSFFVDLLSG